MTENNLSFKEKLDTIFLISVPAIEGHGEDNYCCAVRDNSAIVGVFDGCGGLGSRLYPKFKDHTGAYVSSRLVSGAVYDWYNDNSNRTGDSIDNVVGSLNRYISNVFQFSAPYTAGTLKMRGSMVRDLPTTAAIALIENCSEGLRLNVIWAGDSRVYIIDSKGLSQISVDDLDGEDALSNLSNDGELTNVISSDGKYQLHYKSYKIAGPIMVFAATDGCFGYLPTPMDFENVILTTLIQSETPETFKKRLEAELSSVAGDDIAFAFSAFNFGSFDEMKSKMQKRYSTLCTEYIQPLEQNRDAENAEILWDSYRKDYERFLR